MRRPLTSRRSSDAVAVDGADGADHAVVDPQVRWLVEVELVGRRCGGRTTRSPAWNWRPATVEDAAGEESVGGGAGGPPVEGVGFGAGAGQQEAVDAGAVGVPQCGDGGGWTSSVVSCEVTWPWSW